MQIYKEVEEVKMKQIGLLVNDVIIYTIYQVQKINNYQHKYGCNRDYGAKKRTWTYKLSLNTLEENEEVKTWPIDLLELEIDSARRTIKGECN